MKKLKCSKAFNIYNATTGNRYLGNATAIITEYMTLRDGILAARKNGFLNLKIEGDSKVVIDGYNKKIVYPVKLSC